MSHVRSRVVVAAVAILAAASAVAAPPASGSPGNHKVVSITAVYYNGERPPAHQTLDQAKAYNRTHANAFGTMHPANVVPFDVASGYALREPGYRRTNYVYDSDWADILYEQCPGGECYIADDVSVKIHEYLYGTTSRRWLLTFNSRETVNGTPSYTTSYVYYCAINVAGDPDHYCETSHGADGSNEQGPWNNGDSINRGFESNSYTNIEYPMVGLTVHWSPPADINNGTTAKFRGWDACAGPYGKSCASVCGTPRTANQLCGHSGTGG